jgi:hypothetical protein
LTRSHPVLDVRVQYAGYAYPASSDVFRFFSILMLGTSMLDMRVLDTSMLYMRSNVRVSSVRASRVREPKMCRGVASLPASRGPIGHRSPYQGIPRRSVSRHTLAETCRIRRLVERRREGHEARTSSAASRALVLPRGSRRRATEHCVLYKPASLSVCLLARPVACMPPRSRNIKHGFQEAVEMFAVSLCFKK